MAVCGAGINPSMTVSFLLNTGRSHFTGLLDEDEAADEDARERYDPAASLDTKPKLIRTVEGEDVEGAPDPGSGLRTSGMIKW